VLGFSRTRISPLGIDLGASSVKLLQIAHGDPPQMLCAAAGVLPEEARTDPATRQTFIAETIKKLIKAGSFHGNRIICSLPAYQTLVHHLQLACGKGEELTDQINEQLRLRLNVEPSRMVVRHVAVAQTMCDGSPRQEVICIAASREAVMRHIRMFSQLKLNVVGMHSESAAVLHAFGHLYRRADDVNRTTCFIDIGAATTKVVIAHGREMVFSKTIHAAGDHFTRELAHSQNISFAEARRRREQVQQTVPAAAVAAVQGSAVPTLPMTRGPLAIIAAQMEAQHPAQHSGPSVCHDRAIPGMTAAKPSSAVTADPDAPYDTLESLIDELQLSIRHHQSLFPQRQIEKLVFLGSEAKHTLTCQKIAKAVRIGAQLGDPLARLTRIGANVQPIGVDLRQPQPGWAVPLGLCLCEPNL